MPLSRFTCHIIFTALTIVNVPCVAAGEKVLAIVNSYAPGYEWSDEEARGILNAFRAARLADDGWVIRTFYLDEKAKVRVSGLRASVAAVKSALDPLPVHAAFLMDDAAFKYFLPYFKARQVPIGFSGVQGDLQTYHYTIGESGVTGSLEHYNIPAVIRLLKKIRPSIDSILFVSDDNISGRTHLASYEAQTASDGHLRDLGVKRCLSYAGTDYADLIRTLMAVDPQRTAVIVASYFSYRDRDGHIVPYRRIDQWIATHTQFLDAGLATYQVTNGRLLSIASSSEEMGHFAATQLFLGIRAGSDVSRFGVRKAHPLFLVVNRQRAKQLQLTVPYDVLAYERAGRSPP